MKLVPVAQILRKAAAAAAPRPGLRLVVSRKNPRVKRWQKTAEAPTSKPAPAPKPDAKPAAAAQIFTAEELSLPESALQAVSEPGKLYEQANEAQTQQIGFLANVAKALGASTVRLDQIPSKKEWGAAVDHALDKPGPVIVIAGLKERDGRADEKVEKEYGGNWAGLLDMVRSSIAVDTVAEVGMAMQVLRDLGVQIARRPKDRFAKPTPAGYRDCMLSVRYPNGHIGEIQLHVKEILKVKERGHALFEPVRSIEGTAKKEGRALTPEELQVVADADAQARKIYGDAWSRVPVT